MSKAFDTSTIGGRIKKKRKEFKMSQMELAGLLNIKQNTLSKYEANKVKPNIDLFEDMAKVLETDPKYLAFGEDKLNPFIQKVIIEARKIEGSITQEATLESIRSYARLDEKIRMGMA